MTLLLDDLIYTEICKLSWVGIEQNLFRAAAEESDCRFFHNITLGGQNRKSSVAVYFVLTSCHRGVNQAYALQRYLVHPMRPVCLQRHNCLLHDLALSE